MTGNKYGRLTVVKRAENKISYTKSGKKQQTAQWLCKCDCGNKTFVSSNLLTKSKIKSCGCLKKEILRKRNGVRKLNTYDLTREYGIGYTLKGEEFYFDLEDFDKIKDYTWSFNVKRYVLTKVNNKIYFMHNIINNNYNNEYLYDHINHKEYDNRKENLRIVNNQQNCCNQLIRKNNTSGVTGVGYRKDIEKWYACITFKYKKYHLGYFILKEDAINTRKEAELKFFGEYRCTI